MRSKFRRAFFAGAGLVILSAGLPVLAQDTIPVQPIRETEQQAQNLDTIEVTGSRIKGADMAQQVPVFTLSREAIEKSGLGSIGDVLQQLSSSGKALNSKFNSSGNFGFPADGGGIGAGSAQVDLRHLESKRVLVLVDGLRWVNESSASGLGGSVDLNTIPLAIVERIEVLEDGASAIYGSDAIAGVINIITRRNYTGREVTLNYGTFDEGDGQTSRADLTWGGSTAKFNGIVGLSYFNQKRISSGDRDISRFPVPGTGVTRGSSGTPQGRYIFCDTNIDPNCASNPDSFLSLALDDGTATPVYNAAAPTEPPSTYHGFTNADRFNFAPFNLLLTPNERSSIFLAGRYQLTDNVRAHFKGLYNRRESVNQAAPEPIFIGSGAGTGGIADTIFIPATQQFNPFGQDLDPADNFVLIGRRPLEGGPRIFKQKVDTTYLSGGLSGDLDLFERLLAWDLNLVTSRNEADQDFANGYNVRRIQQALDTPENCAAVPGCVPLNIFGGQGADGRGTITQEMLGWIRINTHDSSVQELDLFSANLSGEIFNLPAGAVGFATGLEHRKYSGSFSPDAVRVAGESQDSRAIPTSGDYDVDEVFAEFNIPLLAGLRGAERLDLSTALRWSDYSTFGSETTGKLGLRWQPITDLTVRSTFSEGFRAPFIGELFGLAQFGASITDPCSNSDGGPLDANCRALGAPPGYEQINPQIITNTGGNPNLKPESADSLTVGVVYSPEWATATNWASRLDFDLTYYAHEIEDAIRAPDAQARLNACVQSGDPNSQFCQGISRTATGEINRFDNLLANIGTFETDGLDLKINWALPAQAWGQLKAAWQSTYVIDYTATDALGTEFPQKEGVEVNDGAIPRLTSNLSLGWLRDRLSADWTLRYISAVTESCSDFLDGTPNSLTNLGLCSEPNTADNTQSKNRLGSVTYHDLRFGWEAPGDIENLKLGFGINNLLGKEPPACRSCSLNGYDAGTYDLPGQFGYVEATYRF
jgi:iron complex outermembrane recepter protein